MTSETWALLGVVVGAVLGGLAQLAGDSIRHRRDTANRVRSERREAYMAFIAASRQTWCELYQWRSLMDRATGSDAAEVERTSPPPGEIVNPAGDALSRLGLAAAAVELVAPADTRSAAMDLQAAVMWFMFKPAEDGLVEKLVEAEQVFADLAKRDLA